MLLSFIVKKGNGFSGLGSACGSPVLFFLADRGCVLRMQVGDGGVANPCGVVGRPMLGTNQLYRLRTNF